MMSMSVYMCACVSVHEHICGTALQSSPQFCACYISPWLIKKLKKLSGGVLAWYLSGVRCRLAYVPADASAATHCLLLQ